MKIICLDLNKIFLFYSNFTKKTACYLPCILLLIIPDTSLLYTFPYMLANDPSLSKLERVYEQSA